MPVDLSNHHPSPSRAACTTRGVSLASWGGIGLLALLLCGALVQPAERGRALPPGSVLTRGAGGGESVVTSGGAPGTGGGTQAGQFQRIEERNGQIRAEYGCRNFNNDQLHARFGISTRALELYRGGYGFSQGDLDALLLWQKKELDAAFQTANRNHLQQEELNRMGAAIKAQYRSRYRSLLVSRGFEILPGNVLAADVPAIARRNVKEVRPFARELAGSVGRGDDSDLIIGGALSLVQTAFRYEPIPMVADGKQTGGILPPLETLARGKGDCDTKSALLASILLNWGGIKLVGVGVPEHYLVAVLRNPAKGDAFIEYQGLRYVLLEPAGPAWLPPGSVGPVTTRLLASGDPVRFEPFTDN